MTVDARLTVDAKQTGETQQAGDAERTLDKSVTVKIVAILDAFRPSTGEMALTDLVERTGLSTSTAYRLANKLVELGTLERDEAGRYRIGLRLWEVASLARRGLSLRDHAAPYMLDLYEATHENVHLAVLEGQEALYVERTTGRTSVPAKAREAQRLPLHATGVGKVLLAYAPGEFVHAVVSAGLTAHTAYTIVDAAQLYRELATIRRNGWAMSSEELTVGTVAVAAPVRDHRGAVVAALSLVGRTEGADLSRLTLAIRTSALGISRELSESAYGALNWYPASP